MAQTSKRQKHDMRTKRENTQLKRALRHATEAQGRATALILGCLVQNGGDITFSQATTDTMNKDIAKMGYRIMPDPGGLVKVCLVMQPLRRDEPAPEPDAVEMSAISAIVLTDPA